MTELGIVNSREAGERPSTIDSWYVIDFQAMDVLLKTRGQELARLLSSLNNTKNSQLSKHIIVDESVKHHQTQQALIESLAKHLDQLLSEREQLLADAKAWRESVHLPTRDAQIMEAPLVVDDYAGTTDILSELDTSYSLVISEKLDPQGFHHNSPTAVATVDRVQGGPAPFANNYDVNLGALNAPFELSQEDHLFPSRNAFDSQWEVAADWHQPAYTHSNSTQPPPLPLSWDSPDPNGTSWPTRIDSEGMEVPQLGTHGYTDFVPAGTLSLAALPNG